MSGLQRLFGNPYTTLPGDVRVRGPPRRMAPNPRPFSMTSERARRPSRRSALVTALGLAPLLLLAAAVPAVAYPAGTVASGSTSYATGAVDVVFPAPLPGVELLDHANHSIGVALVIDNIVEIQPGNTDHPLVVQAATPTNGTPFQKTASGGQNSFTLGLHGTLPVVPVREPLWTSPLGILPPNLTSPLSPAPPEATLVVSYTELPSNTSGAASSGIDVSWSIRNWPWSAAGDLLGVEVQFEVFNATGFTVCPALAVASNTTVRECTGTGLHVGTILWNSTDLASVVGRDHQGLTADFAWGGTEAIPGLGATPVTAGTYFSTAGVDRLTLVAPADGATNVTTDAHLALALPPLPPVLAPVLHGDSWAYVGAIAVFAALAAAGVVAYRRSDRQIRESL